MFLHKKIPITWEVCGFGHVDADRLEDAMDYVLDKLAAEPFCYDVITCDPSTSSKENINDGTERASKKQCVLPAVLRSALIRINPTIPTEVIDGIVKDLCRDFTGGDMKAVNYKLYQQIRNYIKVSVRRNGKQDFDFVNNILLFLLNR